MSYSDFINFKHLSQQLGPNFKTTTENEVIKFREFKIQSFKRRAWCDLHKNAMLQENLCFGQKKISSKF